MAAAEPAWAPPPPPAAAPPAQSVRAQQELADMARALVPLGERKHVCILVCGDEGVGKTSLVNALISRSFTERDDDYEISLAGNPAPGGQWSEAHIPAELNKHRGVEIDLRIVDTLTQEAVVEQLPGADVVVLVYDVTRDETFERAAGFWLDLIQRSCHNEHVQRHREAQTVPVVLVGNKIDRRAGTAPGGGAPRDGGTAAEENGGGGAGGEGANAAGAAAAAAAGVGAGRGGRLDQSAELTRKVMPVLAAHREVEACVECSAARLLNIRQVFYYAQKAVVYPIKPLYDMETATLTEQFKVALRRVFRIFDMDHDGYLSDDELALFQSHCFGARLRRSDISAVKKVIQKQTLENGGGGMSVAASVGTGAMSSSGTAADATVGPGIRAGKVTLSGFVSLNQLFIERNRPESSWLVLRRFGYERMGNDLLGMRLDQELDQNLLDAEKGLVDEDRSGNRVPGLTRAKADQAFELSAPAIAFLNRVFDQFAVVHESSSAGSSSGGGGGGGGGSSTGTTSRAGRGGGGGGGGGIAYLGAVELRRLFQICPAGRAPWEDARTSGANRSGMHNFGFPHSVASRRKRKRRTSSSAAGGGVMSSSAAAAAAAAAAFLDRSGWLGMWALMAHFDPRHVMRYMWYLGYLGEPVRRGEPVREMHLHWPKNRLHVARAIRLTRPRSRVRWAPRLNRQTVRCWVIGDMGSGKEALLDMLAQRWSSSSRVSSSGTAAGDDGRGIAAAGERSAVRWFPARTEEPHGTGVAQGGTSASSGSNGSGKPSAGAAASSASSATSLGSSASSAAVSASAASAGAGAVGAVAAAQAAAAANATRWVRESERALIMTALPSSQINKILNNAQRQDECDIAVLVFDQSSAKSLEWLKIQQVKIPGHIPCLYVALTRSGGAKGAGGSSAGSASGAGSGAAAAAPATVATASGGVASDVLGAPSATTSRAERAAVYADATDWCTSFELLPPTKLSDTGNKKSRANVSVLLCGAFMAF